MINITNKLASDDFIINSGMNYIPFKIVRNAKEALYYLTKYNNGLPTAPFSIRFKGIGMQPFLPNLTMSQVYEYCWEREQP